MYRVGVGEEGGESRETAAAAAAAHSLGDVSSVREKKDNVRSCSAAGAAFAARASFRGILRRERSVSFAWQEETALTLSHSCSPPSLPSPIIILRSSGALSSFVPRHEPRLHVPITRVSR